MEKETLKAIEIVGKILVFVPVLSGLILLLYFSIAGGGGVNASGFCIGSMIVCGIVMILYSSVKGRGT